MQANDSGQIVGAYVVVTGCNCENDLQLHAFVSTGGAISPIPDIGLFQTVPLDINNAGQIVGYYHDRSGDIEDNPRGFLL